MVTKAKKKGNKRSISPPPAQKAKHIDSSVKNGGQKKSPGKGLKPSPSVNTLNRIERDNIVLWKRPFTTTYYALMEIFHLSFEFLQSLLHHKFILFLLSVISASFYYAYITPGSHQEFIIAAEKSLAWWSWWVLLGVLSSIGLGSGLHTFLIYLGPHIAAVTLAAYECNSLDFPEPPYPESIVCPSEKPSSKLIVGLWDIVSKVRVESFLWGAGTAIGELPPYFMARAARLSGNEPEDEEYQEFLELMNSDKSKSKDMSLLDRGKAYAEKFISKVGFPGILLFASIPNPLFDLAGITCGHFLVPFWSFFGATLIGKALIKMHVQMLFVIIAFSEHHVDNVVNLLAQVPVVGESIRQPIKELLIRQKNSLHRAPGTHVEQETTWLQSALSLIVTSMILIFLLSIFNSLAQRYHKRICSKN
ncbi:unnamed protein product [Auanema sp. JU1783]|nr:unnamed protein product [Auanema sp. JU1783]